MKGIFCSMATRRVWICRSKAKVAAEVTKPRRPRYVLHHHAPHDGVNGGSWRNSSSAKSSTRSYFGSASIVSAGGDTTSPLLLCSLLLSFSHGSITQPSHIHYIQFTVCSSRGGRRKWMKGSFCSMATRRMWICSSKAKVAAEATKPRRPRYVQCSSSSTPPCSTRRR